MEPECEHYLFGGITMDLILGKSFRQKSESPKIALMFHGQIQCLPMASDFSVLYLVITEMLEFHSHSNVTLSMI